MQQLLRLFACWLRLSKTANQLTKRRCADGCRPTVMWVSILAICELKDISEKAGSVAYMSFQPVLHSRRCANVECKCFDITNLDSRTYYQVMHAIITNLPAKFPTHSWHPRLWFTFWFCVRCKLQLLMLVLYLNTAVRIGWCAPLGELARDSLIRQLLSFVVRQLFIDIDECASTSHGCDHQCHNTPGSYYCTCDNGYYLGLDGRTCIGKER